MKKGFPDDKQLLEIVDKAWKDYKGDCTVFMSAVGALMFGSRVGWHGLRVCVAGSTFRKYEQTLGIKFREVLPDRTAESTRINGVRLADGIGKFWQAISSGLIPASEGKLAIAKGTK